MASMAAGDSVDGTALRFLVTKALDRQKEEEEQAKVKRQEEEGGGEEDAADQREGLQRHPAHP